MSMHTHPSLEGVIVEEEIHLTLLELCQACGTPAEQISSWVLEGVLEPSGENPQAWRFGGSSLRRARKALHLARDLEINPAGVALALDLMEEIAGLRAQLRRHGVSR